MMLKDVKRRETLRKLAPERMKLKSIKSNKILPKSIKVFLFLNLSSIY
jgi:hypothetical protein